MCILDLSITIRMYLSKTTRVRDDSKTHEGDHTYVWGYLLNGLELWGWQSMEVFLEYDFDLEKEILSRQVDEHFQFR